MSPPETVFEIRNLNKYFGPTHANKDVSLSVKKGEIRGLIGENGSGKSTLMSQIAGICSPDFGEMRLNGQRYSPKSPIEANAKGIAMVVQELGVINNLPVGINIFLGRTRRFTQKGVINLGKLHKAAQEQFETWNLPKIPLHRLAEHLSVEERKIVELVRALSVDPQILLLDEITQSLSFNTRKILYDLIRRFKDLGRTIILITHDVEELIAITDSITVLRDGQVAGHVQSADVTTDQIKSLMVGRDITGDYYHREDDQPVYEDEVVLRVDDACVEGELEGVSFEVHRGEILGFCGLSDSGVHAIGKAVFGLKKLDKGSVCLKSRGARITNPEGAFRNGMAYVPKDRDGEALMMQAAISENICLPSLHELTGRFGFLRPAELKKFAEDVSQKLSVKCTGVEQKMDELSGGNKQKVNLGRWLAKDLDVLVLDCPTRGVDIGVKAYIYGLMKDAKEKGIATILISDELPEVLGMADRLLIMKKGKIQGVFTRGENFTEHSVIGVMI